MSLTKQQVTALYVAVYNRAPDAEGLENWLAFQGTYAEAAAGFVSHPQFEIDYAGMTNQEKVEQFYINILGSAGDAEGIANWVEFLDGGATEAEFLAAFLDASFAYDGDDEAALIRQETLENRVEVALYFTETLGEASNVTDLDDLANDPAYIRSKEAIAGVTADPATVTAAMDLVNEWANEVDPGVPGQTFFLTEGADRDVNAADGFIKGTNDNDTFIADIVQNQSGQQVNTLGTGDRLDGGNGTDTLDVQVTAGAYAGGSANMAVQARTKNIENVKLEAVQSNAVTSGTAGADHSDDVFVNAKDMEGVHYIGSERSNADLIIQDLTSKGVAGGTADMTIGMKYTNNADSRWDESDLEVYFDQDYLLRTPAFSEPTVNIQLMNEDAYSATNGEYPLAGVYLRELTITVNGTEFDLTQYIEEDVAGNGEEIRTYEELLTAIQGAIVELKADHPNNAPLQSLKASMGPLFEADIDPQNGLPRIGESISISMEGETNGVENTLNVQATDLELGRTSGTQYENNNRFERADNDPAVETEDLVTVGVELEKVGRAGDGGDLIIGSMNKDSKNTWSNEDEVGVGTVSGVERFNVTVDGGKTESSSLAGLHSTNNNLREVNVKSAEGSDANLTIGNSNTDFIDMLSELEHAANALKDVQTFNAAEFNGDLTLHAALTGEVTDKYLQNGSAAEDFVYTGGTGNDVFDVLLSSRNLEAAGNTTHGDFNFEINSGAGDDTIFVGIYGNNGLAGAGSTGKAPWLLNQKTNANLSINAGEGDDTVHLEGSGDWIVNLGAGADVIYVDNNGSPTFTSPAKASWIFNLDPNSNALANAQDALTNAKTAQGITAAAVGTATADVRDDVVLAAVDLNNAVATARGELNSYLAGGANGPGNAGSLTAAEVQSIQVAWADLEEAIADALNVADNYDLYDSTGLVAAQTALGAAIEALNVNSSIDPTAVPVFDLTGFNTEINDLTAAVSSYAAALIDNTALDTALTALVAAAEADPFDQATYDSAVNDVTDAADDLETALAEAGTVFGVDVTDAETAVTEAVEAAEAIRPAIDAVEAAVAGAAHFNFNDLGWYAVGAGDKDYNLYKAGITLTLEDNLGGEFELNLSVNPDKGQYQTSQKAINEAIKAAIENDPLFSKLVEAKTGQMADTLIINSLIDGEDVNLNINVEQLAQGATAANITAFNAKFGAGITAAGLAAAYNSPTVPNATAANNAFNGVQKATEEGTDGTTYGEQTITGGTGNDIFVLGTSDNQEHTLVYKGYGNGNDTILNFVDNVDALDLTSYKAKFVDFGSYNANGGWVTGDATNNDFGTATATLESGDKFLRVVEGGNGEYEIEVFEVTAANVTDVTTATNTQINELGTVGTLDFGIEQTFNVDNFLI